MKLYIRCVPAIKLINVEALPFEDAQLPTDSFCYEYGPASHGVKVLGTCKPTGFSM